MGDIGSFYVETDRGLVGPAWTLEVAIAAAREAERAGCRALRISKSAGAVLEGESLRRILDRTYAVLDRPLADKVNSEPKPTTKDGSQGVTARSASRRTRFFSR